MRIVKPRKSFNPVSIVVVFVNLRSQSSQVLEKLAHSGLFIVKLEGAQVGQDLTFLRVLLFPATNRCLIEVVTEDV